MNETFKTELAAFARDVNAICDANPDTCEHCPLVDMNDGYCKAGFLNSKFDPEVAISAVEAYRKRKKPCAEVIDRALDIYTIEIEVERKGFECDLRSAEDCAKHAMMGLKRFYNNSWNTVRVLSAKRFVLESHKEEE